MRILPAWRGFRQKRHLRHTGPQVRVDISASELALLIAPARSGAESLEAPAPRRYALKWQTLEHPPRGPEQHTGDPGFDPWLPHRELETFPSQTLLAQGLQTLLQQAHADQALPDHMTAEVRLLPCDVSRHAVPARLSEPEYAEIAQQLSLEKLATSPSRETLAVDWQITPTTEADIAHLHLCTAPQHWLDRVTRAGETWPLQITSIGPDPVPTAPAFNLLPWRTSHWQQRGVRRLGHVALMIAASVAIFGLFDLSLSQTLDKKTARLQHQNARQALVLQQREAQRDALHARQAAANADREAWQTRRAAAAEMQQQQHAIQTALKETLAQMNTQAVPEIHFTALHWMANSPPPKDSTTKPASTPAPLLLTGHTDAAQALEDLLAALPAGCAQLAQANAAAPEMLQFDLHLQPESCEAQP